jgi:hypothetical protein
MNWQRLRITAETTIIRSRTFISTLIALAGLALVIVGGVNLLSGGVWAPYRTALSSLGITSVAEQQFVYVADVVMIAIGAVAAWVA